MCRHRIPILLFCGWLSLLGSGCEGGPSQARLDAESLRKRVAEQQITLDRQQACIEVFYYRTIEPRSSHKPPGIDTMLYTLLAYYGKTTGLANNPLPAPTPRQPAISLQPATPPPPPTQASPGATDLNQLIQSPTLRKRKAGNSLILTFPAEASFDSGSSTLNEIAQNELKRIAENLQSFPRYLLTVEGHTDDVEKSSEAGIMDRWDLSVARATKTVKALIEMGINPDKLMAAGRGPFKPRVPNDPAANRKRNRRIELIITAL